MKFKTPSFWYRSEDSKPPFIETIITPLSSLYALAHKIHQASKTPEHFDIPIICIGNIVAGGAGKTPVAIALEKIIKSNKLAKNAFFLTRGYGGHLKHPLVANNQSHNFKEIGDEAILLSKHASTIVSKKRTLGAAFAIKKGADLIIMDDGLQNPTIHKDIKFIVIDGTMGFGNKKTIPAGPLRSRLMKSLLCADAFILIGEDKRDILKILPSNKPVFFATLSAIKTPPENKKYLAFTGIGFPEKFFNTLQSLKCDIVKTLSFPDHYPYCEKDLNQLLDLADENDSELITTEKDYIRLPESFKDKVQTLPIELVWNNETAIINFLKDRLSIS